MSAELNLNLSYYCPNCGSAEIYFDAQVQWDAVAEDWILRELHERPWCDSCEDTISHARFGNPQSDGSQK